MEDHERGPPARKQVIAILRQEGNDSRADAQQVKFDRYLEMGQTTIALIQERREAEMGLIRAKKQVEVLETSATDRVVPEVAEGTEEGCARGCPNNLRRFAMGSEMQRIQRSRMNMAS
eukprot:1058577-Pyramimonas_sp.AAC.1